MVDELCVVICFMKEKGVNVIGINFIVNVFNFLMEEQLKVICEEKVDFVIMFFGSLVKVIVDCYVVGIWVFCDVMDLKFV